MKRLAVLSLLIGGGLLTIAPVIAAASSTATLMPSAATKPATPIAVATRPVQMRHGSATRPAASTQPAITLPPALRDGMMIANTAGVLVTPKTAYFPEFQFIQPPPRWPQYVRLLPCLPLASMQAAAAKHPHAIFVIDGQITVYGGNVYLLPAANIRWRWTRHGPASQPSRPQAINLPGVSQENPQTILQNLLRHHLQRPLAAMSLARGLMKVKVGFPSPVPEAPAYWPALPEESYLWNQRGRLIYNPQTREWMMAWQARDALEPNSAITLLPCHLLEVMRRLEDDKGTQVAFRVSGRITQYQQRNFLLLTYVQLYHNLDRF